MTPIRVLLVEDNPGDALLVKEFLDQSTAMDFVVEHLDRLYPALSRAGEAWDVILLDLSLPDAQGLDTVHKMLTAAPEIPIVVMSSLGDQAVALSAVKEGAQDYLVKGQVDPVGLSKALRYAIERAHTQRLLLDARAKSEVLRASETRLRKINEAQKRFVSDAAHELRAPLTSIMGNLELLRRFPNMPPSEQSDALSEAEQEARRMSRLVSDLLTLARGDGGISIRQEKVPLHEVLLSAFNEARHMAKGQRLEINLSANLNVYGEADYLKQLVLILLDNAIKYTPSSGTVRLELQAKTPYAEFSVQDDGVGISEEDLLRVFERFYRVDKSRTQDPGGSGLGLSIAKWILETHKGQITLQSSLGKGTRVVVRIPLEQSAL